MTDVTIRVIVDPKRAIAGSKQAKTALQGVGATAGNLRRQLIAAFAAGGTIIAIRNLIGTLANFEQAMSTVQAITGATAEEFAALEEEARRLGGTTRFTATQAAEGITFLARAGFDATESLEAVESTLKLAQSGALDLGRAADIASNVLTGFRLEVDQSARVVDVLALAANTSNTTVGQLGDALKFVAPVAAGVGVTIEETTAAVSALSDAGLQASLAGTGLRRVLAELESPGTKTEKILEQLGLTAADIRVSTVGLSQALRTLRDAGVDTGTALEIFGQRGGPAFEVLSTSIPKIVGATDALGDAGGTADRVAEIMDDNLNGAILRVRSAFEALVLSVGDSSGDSLTGGFNALAGGLRATAENLDVVAGGFGVLSAVILTRFVPAGISAINATLSLQATIAGVAGSAAVAAGAFAAVGAAVAIGAIRAAEEFEELNQKILETTEAGRNFALTEFGNVGAQIVDTQEKLERLEDLFQSGANTSDLVRSKIKEYREELERLELQQSLLTDGTVKTVEEAEEELRIRDDLAASVERLSGFIEEENRILRLNSREREVQTRLLREVAKLEKEGGEVTPEQREQLRLLLERNQLLHDQADILDRIEGPQQQLQADIRATAALLASGRINLIQYNLQLAELLGLQEQAAGGGGDLPEFNIPGFPESDVSNIQNLAPLEQIARDADLLQEQFERGALSSEQLNAGLRQLDIAALELEQGGLAGVQRGFLKSLEGLRDFSAGTEEATTNLIDGSLDALTDGFIEFGSVIAGAFEDGSLAIEDFQSVLDALEGTFSQVVDQLVADLARLLAQEALFAILDLISPGAGSALGGLLGGSRAEGGGVNPSRAFLVGEEGPELFRPPQSGTIVPNQVLAQQTAQQMQPVVNVPPQAPPTVNVNVDGIGLVRRAFQDPSVQEEVFTTLQNNPNRARQVTTT